MTKIGIIFFEMTSDTVAGDRDTAYHTLKGFQKIGIDVELLFIYKKKKKLDKYLSLTFKENEYKIMSWDDENDLKELDNYDFLLFNCLSPHGTKKNPPKEGWEKVWKIPKTQKFVMISDPYWKMFYYHGIKIKDYIDGLIIQNEAGKRGMKEFPIKEKAFIKLAYDTDDFIEFSSKEKENRMVCFSFWKTWKNHKYLLESLKKYGKEIKDIIEIRLFSDGMEQRKMSSKRQEIREKYKYYNLWEESGKYFYYGGLVPEEIKKNELTKSKFILDLSWSKNWNGNITYNVLEGLKYGNLPVVSLEHFHLDERGVINVKDPRNPDEIYKALLEIKNIDNDLHQKMVSICRNYIKENYDAKKIAKQMLYYMENKDTDGSFKIYKKQTLFDFLNK